MSPDDYNREVEVLKARLEQRVPLLTWHISLWNDVERLPQFAESLALNHFEIVATAYINTELVKVSYNFPLRIYDRDSDLEEFIWAFVDHLADGILTWRPK